MNNNSIANSQIFEHSQNDSELSEPPKKKINWFARIQSAKPLTDN